MTTNTPVCPTPNCSAAAEQILIRHSLLHTRRGTTQRWRCKRCGRTFTARSGTVYHRLRSSPARFDRVVHMIVEGMSKAANSRVNSVSTATVTRWSQRAAASARSFNDRVVRDVEASELQGDEMRGFAASKDGRNYVFAVEEIGARLWLSQLVRTRTKRNTRLIARDSRRRCARGRERVLFVTDQFKYYSQEIVRAWSSTCLHVETRKAIKDGKVVRIRQRISNGQPWQLERALDRCEDSKRPNTSYIERLNLFIRRGLSCFHRRTNSMAKRRETLQDGVSLLQLYYNFVRPHSSLPHSCKRDMRTPAQQAKLVTRPLSFRDIFMSFRPVARVPWLINPEAKREWSKEWQCVLNNS